MSNLIGWEHPIDNSDQWDGFNESGMQHFAGSPIKHLAREVIQNALDAGESDTVVVKIQLHEVLVSSIPNVDELKENIKSCYGASKNEGRKAEIFFEAAKTELEKSKITVLEISDYNTKGMKGPSKNGTPFYAFMKAKGQSKKESETATGSYGIGKFAPYTVSKLRTIFLSTIHQDDSGNFTQLTQGKSILMSHDIDGKRKQGIGFWGLKDRCQPVTGVNHLPEWIERVNREVDLEKNKGSKLSILCFDAQKNWQEILAVSVAENFFAAISDGKLKVEIDGKYTLDQNSIRQLFNDENSNKLKELISSQKNEPEQFNNSKHYLAAYQGGIEVITEESQTNTLGLCQLKIWVAENLPKKVCTLRNGMFISDGIAGLKVFSDFKEFVAVFHCQDKKGNELLRSMEPPRHDDFEVDLLPTKTEQLKGKKALKEISEWVRECLRRHAKDPVSDVTEIDELKDFFGDDGDSDTGKGTQEINPYGDIVIRGKPIKTKLQPSNKIGNGTDGGDEPGDNDGGGGADGAGGGDGKGGIGKGTGGTGSGAGANLVDINNVRAILSGAKSRRISFTPVHSGQIRLSVKEAGADSDYDVAIATATEGTIKGEGIILDVISGNRVTLDIELNQDFSGALKVMAYEI